MNLVAVSAHLPTFDRASGDLRFFQMLRLLAREHRVLLATFRTGIQRAERGDAEIARYRSALEDAGIKVLEDGVVGALRREPVDIVLLETHSVAAKWLERVRFEQPAARVIIDSVDCHFLRLARYAELTGHAEDHAAAASEREHELAAYAGADLIIAVTEEDRRLLAECLPGKALAVIPNIHAMPARSEPKDRTPGRMMFVGGFKHQPNVDAVGHFCAAILPRIHAEAPTATLVIAGSDPPPSVSALARDRIEVLGYVPDLSPLLRSAAILVAPLRYGAGLKGKVGEAMSFGVPVVTTSVGAEGFGIESGTDAIVADDPAGFAAAVVLLLRDPALATRIGEHGRALVRQKLSEDVVATLIRETVQGLLTIRPSRLPISRRLRMASSVAVERNLLWRFR